MTLKIPRTRLWKSEQWVIHTFGETTRQEMPRLNIPLATRYCFLPCSLLSQGSFFLFPISNIPNRGDHDAKRALGNIRLNVTCEYSLISVLCPGGIRHRVDPPQMRTATPDGSIGDRGALPSDVADFCMKPQFEVPEGLGGDACDSTPFC
jgi:hypothetical protein